MQKNPKQNLEYVKNMVGQLAPAREVKIVAISKGRSAQEIRQLYDLGIRDFGENRLQEGLEKIKECKKLGMDGISWHFVGTIQRNKVKEISKNFAYVHSLDRLELIDKIAKYSSNPNHPVKFFIQVNISNESSKHGFEADKALEAASYALEKGLDIIGFMGMASNEMGKGEVGSKKITSEFAMLDKLRKEAESKLGKHFFLSAGMSGDYEIALAHGADFLRIGQAIFE